MSAYKDAKIAVGLKRGYPTTARAQKARPARRKGSAAARVKIVRSVIREVAGLSPLEKRLLDIIKLGIGNVDKKVYKTCKKRLGTHRRALLKRDDVKRIYQVSKMQQ